MEIMMMKEIKMVKLKVKLMAKPKPMVKLMPRPRRWGLKKEIPMPMVTPRLTEIPREKQRHLDLGWLKLMPTG